MLVFGMKDVQYVVINDSIVVRMKREGNDVKLCIDAPRDVLIERDKIYEQRCLKEDRKPAWDLDTVETRRRPASVRLYKSPV